MPDGTVRIDAHHHVWDLAVRDQPWTAGLPALRRSFGMADLRPELAAGSVEGTVVVQTVCVPDETPELLALAAADPAVRGVIGWVDLTAADAADQVSELRRRPGGAALVGVRHQVQDETDPDWLRRPDVRRGLAALPVVGATYDFVITAAQLPAVIDTVRALPTVRFVLDHAGNPPIASGAIEPWRTHIAELAQAPNVAVKLSGLVVRADPERWTLADLRPYVDALLETFGAQRIMFGSDWPVCLLAADYGEVLDAAQQLTAALSAPERAAIFGGTAQHWYGLR